ncbi:hypothetical protein N2152v2_003891 [Parachlorella kessleri]
MYLYSLTLSRASAITCAIYGNFSAAKVQEIVVSRGKVLELLRPDEQGKVQVIYSTEVFGVIRSLQPFRFPGAQQDYVIAGSDSGRVVILQYSKEKNEFVKVHQETFGKSGCRRIVPGEFVAADPKGRACLVGAVEKAKFVYVLNRDNEANLTISSPLEAHKSHNIVFSRAAPALPPSAHVMEAMPFPKTCLEPIVGLDMGFDNPVFAAIELDYAEADQDPTGEAASEAQKHLTLYELDLGLNHVVRKYSEPVDNGANLLVPVPGGGDGPGGVLVCAENFVIYAAPDHPELRAVIPRRTSLPAERGVLLTCAASHKQKNMFFVLVQSEYGDLYKVSLDYEGETVRELRVKYFDTIPPANSICVLRKGFLFAASEFGDHALYQFQALGDDDAVEASSSTLMETEEGFQPVFFEPRPLANLELIDRMESLCPILDMKVANLLGEEIPQIYAACGRGARSTLRVLRPGLAVTEMAVSPLPGNPTAVWTVKRSQADEYDAYIVVSFTNATLVLSIGETVEEVNDSGFNGNVPTSRVQLLADDSMLQMRPVPIVFVEGLCGDSFGCSPTACATSGQTGASTSGGPPQRRTIVRATSNERQAVIALSGGELIYFELNVQGMLIEAEKREMGGDVASLDVAPVPEGRQRSRFLAVGMYDNTVRVLSLDPEDTMKVLATQAAPATPESVLLLDSPSAAVSGSEEGAGAGALFLQVGLANGVLLRTEVDRITGQLSDTRTRFLGTKAPKLFGVPVRGSRSMLALSSRPWLGYSGMGKFNLVPMSYEALDYASGFSSEQCPEGFVAVAKNTLRVLTIERLGEFFNQQALRLRYTPRKFTIHPDHKVLLIAESDHQAIPLAERSDLAAQPNGMDTDHANGAAAPHQASQPLSLVAIVTLSPALGPEADEESAAREEQYGAPKGEPGTWASCIRVVDPAALRTTCCLELDSNEAALSMCLASFEGGRELGTLLCVGTAQGLKFYPRECQGGFVRVYRVLDGGKSLELLHKTPVGGIPGAMAAFKGRLVVGVNNVLRLYDLGAGHAALWGLGLGVGKKRLLKKCEYWKFPSHVSTISVSGSRLYVGDAQESLFYLKYKKSDNRFYVFADDIVPRHVTAALPLDYDTVAGADKFGNLFVSRLPADVSQQVEEDPTGGKYAQQTGQLGGAPNRLETVINFHVGETITSLQRAAMQPGGREVVLYSTLLGGIGALLPFTSREDVDFFQHLEMHMRQEHPPLMGRDHMSYRQGAGRGGSAYFPVKDVVDGDLCEQYSQLTADKQRQVAEELDRTPGECMKKLEDVRNRII